MCLIADYCNRVKTPTNDRKHLSGFQFILGDLQWSSFSAKQYELWRFYCSNQSGRFPMCPYVQMFMCACVRNGCGGGICCCVVVEWVHRWACLFWCAGFLLLSISQGLGGTQGGHMTGPCKAELVTPVVPQQTHPFGVLLSLHCQPTPQHGSRHGDEPDVPSPY